MLVTQSDTGYPSPFTLPPTTLGTRLALDFMLRYKTRRSKGNETIATDIYKAVSPDSPVITRQRLDHWFSGRRNLTDDAFVTIYAFLFSDVFKKLVPEIESIADAQKKILNQGQVLAELEGTFWPDNNRLFSRLGGFWVCRDDDYDFLKNTVVFIEPVEGENFAIYHQCEEIIKVEKQVYVDWEEGDSKFEPYDKNKKYPLSAFYEVLGIEEDGTLTNSLVKNVFSGFVFSNKYKNRYEFILWSRINRRNKRQYTWKFDEKDSFLSLDNPRFTSWEGRGEYSPSIITKTADGYLGSHGRRGGKARGVIVPDKIKKMFESITWSIVDYGSS